jgi:glutaredoxin 3
MAATPVTLYTTSWCPFCQRALALLARKGASFTNIDVEAEPARRAEMVERSGGARTVPQIFIGARHVGGCDELVELERRGELDALLATPAG